jgi:hypothetical protein
MLPMLLAQHLIKEGFIRKLSLARLLMSMRVKTMGLEVMTMMMMMRMEMRKTLTSKMKI